MQCSFTYSRLYLFTLLLVSLSKILNQVTGCFCLIKSSWLDPLVKVTGSNGGGDHPIPARSRNNTAAAISMECFSEKYGTVPSADHTTVPLLRQDNVVNFIARMIICEMSL